mmetsp:Transcript_12868/g.24446  ORF Transcript_12868/g.24446 Transcript_12868/m.24446 type:complete len:137 (-) Transcript_12868:60-470(-)
MVVGAGGIDRRSVAGPTIGNCVLRNPGTVVRDKEPSVVLKRMSARNNTSSLFVSFLLLDPAANVGTLDRENKPALLSGFIRWNVVARVHVSWYKLKPNGVSLFSSRALREEVSKSRKTLIILYTLEKCCCCEEYKM